MAAPAAKAPVLNGPEDWHDWLDCIKDLSTSKRVWAYVDPSLTTAPALVEPSVPTVRDVMPTQAVAAADTAAAAAAADGAAAPPTVTVLDLDENQRAALGILQRTYAQEFALWQAKDSALQHVNDVIKATTGQHYQAYITGVTAPYERIKALKQRVCPTDTARTDEVRDAYRAALAGLRSTDWQAWLHGWEKALKDGQRLKIPEVQGTYPTKDFLRAVAPVTRTFTEVQEVENTKLQTKGDPLPDALVVSAQWRNYMLSRTRSAQSNAFNTTLQGQGLNDSAEAPDGRPPLSSCVCGMKHPYADCYYLFPNLRPDGWKPNPGVEKRIETTLTKNDRIRRNVDRVKQRHAASAAPAASPAPSPNSEPEPKPDSPGLVGASYKTHGLIG
jgi:hypothetical protein